MRDLNDEIAAVDQSPSQESPCHSPLSVKSIASKTASIISKEKHKLNLIIYNYPEPTPTDSRARKKEDIENISILLNKYVVPATVTNAICIGKQCNRCRLTKITVSTVEEKSSTLCNCQNKVHPSHVQKVLIGSVSKCN